MIHVVLFCMLHPWFSLSILGNEFCLRFYSYCCFNWNLINMEIPARYEFTSKQSVDVFDMVWYNKILSGETSKQNRRKSQRLGKVCIRRSLNSWFYFVNYFLLFSHLSNKLIFHSKGKNVVSGYCIRSNVELINVSKNWIVKDVSLIFLCALFS